MFGWKTFHESTATSMNTEFSTTCDTKLSQISFGCKIFGWAHLCWASLAKPENIKFVPGEPHVDFCPLLGVNPEALTQWQQTGNVIGDRKIYPCTHTRVMPLFYAFVTTEQFNLLNCYFRWWYRNWNSCGIIGPKHFCNCSEDFKIWRKKPQNITLCNFYTQ